MGIGVEAKVDDVANRQNHYPGEAMMRFHLLAASCAAVLVLAGCSKDSGDVKSDSAAADSIRDAHDSAVADTATANSGSAADSVQGSINSTEGTIGETRKRVRMHEPDTAERDSVRRVPMMMMDSLGHIKR
jgi:hypothetical protein